MLDSMYIINSEGERFDFTVGTNPPNLVYPVKTYDVQVEGRGTRNNKMQAHGTWPGPTYMGGATITFEGAVFGDTYTLFNDAVINLKYYTHPSIGVIARDNVKCGTLYIKPTGGSRLKTDYAFVSFDMPMDGNTHADWQWVIYSFDPFFTEVTSGNRYMF